MENIDAGGSSPTGSHEHLLLAERAAAAPYLDHPPTPRWYPPAAGAWFAGLVFAFGALRDQFVWLLVAVVGLLGLLSAFTRWYGRRWGTWPSLKQVPAEIDREMKLFAAGLGVIAVPVIVVVLAVGPVLASAVTFVAVTGWVIRYERAYRSAAARVRERLG